MNESERVLSEALERISIMEASVFWKLRNRWHNLKRRWGLSNGAIPRFKGGALSAAPDLRTFAYATSLPEERELALMRRVSASLVCRPYLSVITATFNPKPQHLQAMLDSVIAQAYPYFELCIADDASTDASVRRILEEYACRDKRIRLTFRSKNGHVSAATNSALALASGEFVVFADHDDVLAPDALFELTMLLNARLDADIVYCDEDKLDEQGRLRDPHFKPDWAPESFLSRMYIGHFVACRRSLVERLGGLRPGFEGSQDYDFILRASELTDRIYHIPKILYHWRIHDGSTAASLEAKPYSMAAAERALNEALDRRGEPGRIEALAGCPGTYAVRFEIRDKRRVSVIIPTRDHGEDVQRCVQSALAHTSYPDLEIIIIDNGSTDLRSLQTFDNLRIADSRIAIVRYNKPFNFSAINNFAVSLATGGYLLFLNNDTEVISNDWIEAMVEHVQRPPIGAAGALLLYRDHTVQHAGVILGLGGVAGHSHKHIPALDPGYFHMLRALNNYSAVTGACLMVRREVFAQVGGFDESLAVAFNDVDLCLRIGQAGFRNIYLPHVVLYHDESKSRGPETQVHAIERFQREIATMKARWAPLLSNDPYYNANLTLDREDYSLRVRSRPEPKM